MPIMSYLAYPVEGKKEELANALGKMPECEIKPALNQDLLLLVTDTLNEEQEKSLQERLKGVESLGCLALVAGYNDQETFATEQ